MLPPQSKKTRFKTLTFGFYGKLYRVARVRLSNDQDTDDILQDTYMKAYQSFDSLKDQAMVEQWLMRILLNTIKDHGRRMLREPFHISIDEISEKQAADLQKETDPEYQMSSRELSPALMDALRSLPEIFLSPLILREIHHASYQEIARILSIPVGTVMSRLARARSLLRSKLSKTSVLHSEAQSSEQEMR